MVDLYRDPLFPIQPPEFLFAYTLTIVRASLLADDTDDEGWPILASATTTQVRGYVSPPDPRTLVPQGEAVDAVALVPNGTVVDHRDLLDVPGGQNIPLQLVGRFHINQVRPNPSHVRCLLTRIADPAGAEA